MTVFSLVLMGGNYFFPWTGVHEVLGAVLFVLWGVHVALNRRWYASLAKGAYRPFRIMQAVVNCGILACALFLMISGIMISQHVFAFLGISGGANFARKAHMLASHWYFLFMSLHIGLHAGMISRKVAAKSKRTTVGNQADGGQKVGVRRVCTVYGTAPSLATTKLTTMKTPSVKWLKLKKICAVRLL